MFTSFVWGAVWSVIKGIVSRNLGAVIISGLVSLGLGAVYYKGRASGYKSAESKLLPEITFLKKENQNYKTAIAEIQTKEREENAALEDARKAGEAVKPVNSNQPDKRLREIGAYPGCRDCK